MIYSCAACGKGDLTETTAVHVPNTEDYLCGTSREVPGKKGIYDTGGNLSCILMYTSRKTMTAGAVGFICEPIQMMKAANNTQRV